MQLFCWGHTEAQRSYQAILAERLEQIRKLPIYDEKVLFAVDTVEYNDMAHPYWKPDDTYYEGDVARYKYCIYVALNDSKGERPDTTRQSWDVLFGPHPALFLRDTAKQEDLRKLLSDRHPYVRLYAFTGLSLRNETNPFPVILQNLSDTTKIEAYWADVGYHAFPADIMVACEAPRSKVADRNRLKKLIKKRYPHLKRSLESLQQAE